MGLNKNYHRNQQQKLPVGIESFEMIRKEKKENYFHGILVGILGFKDEWYVKSNDQTGDGYCDILIEIEREDIGIIIEVKYAERAKYTEALDAAFAQIKELDYVNKLQNDDFHTVYKYGIACFKRKCRVSHGARGRTVPGNIEWNLTGPYDIK